MRTTIFIKMFGGYALIIVAGSVLALLLSWSGIRAGMEDVQARELEHLGRAVASDLAALFKAGDEDGIDAFLKDLGPKVEARATMIDPQGRVLGDSRVDPKGMENHRYRPEVVRALEGGIGRSIRLSATVEERMLYVGVPLKEGDRILGVVRLSLDMKTVDDLLHGLRRSIGRAVALTSAAALLLAFLVSLHFTRPIARLTWAARQVTEGKLETRVAVRNMDEFRDLAEAFNGMTARIRRLFAELSAEKNKLDRVLASLQDGLLAVDKDGRVTMANAAFEALAGVSGLEGRFAWEVLRKPRLLEVLDRARAERRPRAEEVAVDGRVFLSSSNPLAAGDGVLLSFHDITELKRTEALKRDLVVNVSHELRTPLAAISGAVETLEGSAPALDRAALAILKRHAERLRRIVDDLLSLARLEDRDYRLDIRTIDLRRLAAGVLETFAGRLAEKGLKADLRAPEDLPALEADPGQVEQLLVNLVDNAVKYTERGSVEIALSADPAAFTIEVRDTGIGIPEEHRARIFERFYVVDPSRSRKLGGTGLGLSIVKHIAELHGGSVSVSSRLGEGSTFVVRLPRRA